MFAKLTAKIPDNCFVATSGGADSMAALHFCCNHNKRKITVLHIVHRKLSESSKFDLESKDLVESFAAKLNLPVMICYANIEKINKSVESDWSDCRREIYNGLRMPVVVAHNLDDAMEWWMMRACRGKIPNLLQPHSGNVIRPFLAWSKTDVLEYCEKNNIPYHQDPTNFDGSNFRSQIRTKLIPTVDEIGDLRGSLRKEYTKLKIS